MNYAYVVNDVVQMVDPDPIGNFGPGFGGLFVEVPDEVQMWWIRDPLTNTYSAPPPPPLTRNNFESAFNSFLGALAEAKRAAQFEAALALSPNYPALPNTLADFVDIMNGMEWPE